MRKAAAVTGLLALLAGAVRAADPAVEAEIAILRKHAKDPMEQDDRRAAVARLGKIGGEEAAAALFPLFEDPFVHLRDHAVSAWIAMLRGSRAPETQTFLSRAGLGHADPAVRRGAVVALSMDGGPELADPFRLAISREEDPGVIEALAEGSRRLRGDLDLAEGFVAKLKLRDPRALFAAAIASVAKEPARARAALDRLLESRTPLARAGAVLALQEAGMLRPEQAAAVLADAADEPRMALAESLERRTATLPWPGEGKEALAALLAADSWRVRAAAIDGALRLWEPGVVPLLVARLAEERGRLRDDLTAALATITGKDLGDDLDLWRAWWEANGGTFRPGERPRPGPGGRIPTATPGERGPAGDGDATVAFFRLPVRSTRIAFLFDCSGSMRDPAGSEPGLTKFDIARREFARTLAALPPETAFDVFLYRYPTTYPPKPALTRALGKVSPATPAHRAKATDWLEKEEGKGWGAFYDGLVAILAEEVDTIFFLSDGRPSRGTYDRDFRLIQELAKENRFRRVVVHAVLAGTSGADREFMRELATSTGGRFTDANPVSVPR
jgi:HEAT repeat protein